jgi:hypothetical protein
VDPLGFSVRFPVGWAVSTGDDGHILVHDADKKMLVLIQPFLLRQAVSARDWVAKATEHFSGLFPGASIERTKQQRQHPDELLADVRYTSGSSPGRAEFLCAINGRAGMLYGIAAPSDRFTGEKDTMLHVLKSFSFKAPANQGRPDSGVRCRHWADPAENAFSTEVPVGWKVNGGLLRHSALDYRLQLQMASPDGQIRITSGDWQIPGFVAPNPMLIYAGFHEGSLYSIGQGVVLKVASYLPGEEFARSYVAQRVVAGGSNLHFSQASDRHDLTDSINRLYAKYGVAGSQWNVTAGDVHFTFERGGKTLHGYYFAATRRGIVNGMTGLWQATCLCGYVTTPEMEKRATAILAHVQGAARLNTQWAMNQERTEANVSRIVAQTNEDISNTIMQSYESREKTLDDLSRKWSNTTLGLTDVRDPETGETWKVASGHNYYWHNGSTIVGTATADPPDIDFSPLKEW